MNTRFFWMLLLGFSIVGCGTAATPTQYAVSPEQVTLSVYEAAFKKDYDAIKPHLTDELLSAEQSNMAQAWGKRLDGVKAPYEFSVQDEKRSHSGSETTVLMSTPKGIQEVHLQLIGKDWRIRSAAMKSP